MKPGDTVFWHPDVIHAVEFSNTSTHHSSVLFLGVAPDCARNRYYQQSQLACFADGLSPPDYPAVNAESSYKGRAALSDLDSLGRRLMGMDNPV